MTGKADRMPGKTKKLLFLLLVLVCVPAVFLIPARRHSVNAPPPQGSVAFGARHGVPPYAKPKDPFATPPWTRPEEDPTDGAVPPVTQSPEPYAPDEDHGPVGRHAAAPGPSPYGGNLPGPPPHTRASYQAASAAWGIVVGILFAVTAILLSCRVIPRKREPRLPDHTKE